MPLEVNQKEFWKFEGRISRMQLGIKKRCCMEVTMPETDLDVQVRCNGQIYRQEEHSRKEGQCA